MRATHLVDAKSLRLNHSNNKTNVYFRAVSSVASCIIPLICLWSLSYFFPDLELGVWYMVESRERHTHSTNVYCDKSVILQA
jgi:hypothetical protein